MLRQRITCSVCLAALAAIPTGAQAAPHLVSPPKLLVTVERTSLRVGASSFLWEGQMADGLAVGQMKLSPLFAVKWGATATLRLPYTADKITITEIVAGKLKGTTVSRARGVRTLTWKPRLQRRNANVEVFVNTKNGFASYAFALTRTSAAGVETG